MKLDDINIFIIPILIYNIHYILLYSDVAMRIMYIIYSLTYR